MTARTGASPWLAAPSAILLRCRRLSSSPRWMPASFVWWLCPHTMEVILPPCRSWMSSRQNNIISPYFTRRRHVKNMPTLFLHITLDSHVYPHYTKDMDMATRYLRRFCDIWLAVFCTLTLPWGGVVFAAVVVIVYLFTRKSNHTCWRIAMAVVGYMIRQIWYVLIIFILMILLIVL